MREKRRQKTASSWWLTLLQVGAEANGLRCNSGSVSGDGDIHVL